MILFVFVIRIEMVDSNLLFFVFRFVENTMEVRYTELHKIITQIGLK